MVTNEKIQEYVSNWMDGHESDTFINNKNGQMIYKSECGTSGINLKLFFEELLQDFTDEVKQVLEERL